MLNELTNKIPSAVKVANDKIRVCSDTTRVSLPGAISLTTRMFSCWVVQNETESSMKVFNLFHFTSVARSTQLRICVKFEAVIQVSLFQCRTGDILCVHMKCNMKEKKNNWIVAGLTVIAWLYVACVCKICLFKINGNKNYMWLQLWAVGYELKCFFIANSS